MSIVVGEHPIWMTTILVAGSTAHLVVPSEDGVLVAPQLEFAAGRADAAPVQTYPLELVSGEWMVTLTEAQVAALSGVHFARVTDGGRTIAAGYVQYNPGWEGDSSRVVTSSRIIYGGGGDGGGGGVTDHGALDGLTDDDHAHYALADGTRGDFAPTTHGHVLADISDYTAPEAPPSRLRVPWAGWTDAGYATDTGSSMRTGQTILAPLFIRWDCDLTDLAVQVVSASEGDPTIQLVVYDSGPDGLPLNRLALESVDVSSEGQSIATLGTPVPVEMGMRLWVGAVMPTAESIPGLIIPYATHVPSGTNPPEAVLAMPYSSNGWRGWGSTHGVGLRLADPLPVLAASDYSVVTRVDARWSAQIAIKVAP